MKNKKLTLTNEQLAALISQFDPTKDPILKRAIALGQKNHLPLDKAIEIAKQELTTK